MTEAAAAGEPKRPRAKFEPPEGKCLMVIGAGWEKDIDRYKKATGDSPGGVKLYYYPNGTDTTYFWHCAREENPKGGVVTMMLNLTKGTHGDLKPYLRGDFDEGLTAIGRAIKTWGGPVYVSIEGEVDVQLVRHLDDEDHRIKYTTQEFCDVFRRIHKLWDGLGVDNVAYIWWSICDGMQDRRHYDYYPGDEWVDYVGISLYEPKQVGNAVILKRFADSHKKPMMVMECGPPYNKTHIWEDWHDWFLRACERLDMKLICYNNWGYHPEWYDEFFCNSAFDKLPRPIGIRWGREMKSNRYLHASPGLYLKLGADRGGDGLTADGGAKAGIITSATSPSGDTPANGGRQPRNGLAVDLLKKIDPSRDAISGDWTLSGGVLAFAGDQEWSKLMLPGHPPEEYDLTVVAERVQGAEILVVGLVVGGKQAMVLLDGWGGGASGLDVIDGKASGDNETTHRGWRFVNGRRTTIDVKVRKAGITVRCDGKQIFDWKGDSGRLSLVEGWKVPNVNRLFLGGWKGGSFRLHKVEIRPVGQP